MLRRKVKRENTESEDDFEEEMLVPTFGEAVAGYEDVRRYMCSFKLDDDSLAHLNRLEKELLFMRHTCPTKQTSLLDYLKK